MNLNNLGIAIDVGTTTVALHLVNVKNGEKIASIGRVNAQVPYGADVTSRIQYCMSNGHEKLTELIREQIDDMIKGLLGKEKGDIEAQLNRIESITIAGNTVMQHLVAGYSPISMGTVPFTPISLFGEILPIWDSLPVSKNASIYYTPSISAYVGGDITAGLLAAGFENIKSPAFFIDIGTNGEIVLKKGETYFCCATAAGPAFEGAEISQGMAAVDGAVDHVWLSERGEVSFSVIGGKTPNGLCGSGLLDLLAVLLELGEVDETGRLLGKDRFTLTEKESGIYITAEDVRKLQLAKAAIAAGIRVLLHHAGIAETGVKLLALAGGFGSFMSLKSAAKIGLFPKALLPVAKTYGNTAGEGAVMAAFLKDAYIRLEKIRKQCEYIELSSSSFFNEKYVDEMMFE